MSTAASPSKAVLVPGCSSGIGRATAVVLAKAGLPTWASARRPEALAELEAAGCRVLQLDVNDEESCGEAVDAIVAKHGAVGALVNNAGFSQRGPIEEVTIDAARRQFETNIFAVMRLTQLVLPGMRAQRHGTIVNLGSTAGLVTLPGAGVYCMSKPALEAMSDALRFEVAPFGVRVVLLEPQGVRTELVANDPNLVIRPDSPYLGFMRNLDEFAAKAFRPGARTMLPPDAVAKAVVKAITAKRPRARYAVGAVAKALPPARRAVPDHLWDSMVRRMFPFH